MRWQKQASDFQSSSRCLIIAACLSNAADIPFLLLRSSAFNVSDKQESMP